MCPEFNLKKSSFYLEKEFNLRIFLIQNDNDLQNFSLIGCSQTDIFIDLTSVCGDVITSSLPKNTISLTNRIFASNKFYESSKFLKFIKAWEVDLEKWLSHIKNVHEINIGWDGAFQRKIISFLKARNPKMLVRQWCDGLLEPHLPSVNLKLRRVVMNCAETCGVSWLVPSEVGKSKLVDEVYVLSDSCKCSLVFNGVSENKIKVKKFPRYKAYFEASEIHSKLDRVLLCVSAFAWHGHHEAEAWEISMVEDFISAKICGSRKVIRPHPRSSEKMKRLIARSGYASRNDSISKDIIESGTVVSFASTALFEAKLANREVFVYATGAPQVARGTFIEQLPQLECFDDL